MTRRQATLFFGAALLAIVAGIFIVWRGTQPFPSSPTRAHVRVGDATVQAMLAQTPEEHARGLSSIPSLPPDEGMLFLFPQPTIQQFWMKEMRFSIDIVWISAERRVVAVHESVAPSTYPELFSSNTPVVAVLEVPAGWVAAHNVAVGAPVSWESR